MGIFKLSKELSIVIVDPSSGVRPIMSAVLREAGYEKTNSVSSLEECVNIMAVEPVHWVITSPFLQNKVNVLQLLSLTRSEPKLEKLKISLFLAEDERFILPRAFAWGLFTCHSRPFNKEKFAAELNQIKELLEEKEYHSALVAAEYLRPVLKERPKELLYFEQNLQRFYPERADLLLALAEAHFLCGNHGQARSYLWQAGQIDPTLTERIANLGKQYPSTDNLKEKSGISIEIKSCVVVEPDISVQTSLKELLTQCGAESIQVFSDGNSYWNWQKDNPQPDIVIMEWKIPGVTAPLLIQRLRAINYCEVAIIVHSSLIQKADQPLLKEMGVLVVVEKPFRRDDVLNCIMNVLNQNQRPTEMRSLEQKILNLLQSKQVDEARHFMNIYSQKYKNQDGHRKHLEAEFAFATDHFQEAKELAMLAIKLGNQSVRLLNLLGKALLRLQDFSAALSVFKKADSIAPNSISRLCAIADTQQQLGNADAAVASLEKATDLDPDNQELINSKVNIGLSAGNSELVKESIDRYASSDSILAFINNRAIVHAKSGEFEEGIKLYNNALSALPKDKQRLRETVFYNLALAYARKNDAAGVSKVLADLKEISDPLLARKISSLRKRADEAVNDGSPIKLFSDNLPSELKEEQAVDPLVRMFDRLTVQKFPNCCVELYKEEDSNADEKINPLIKDTISFNLRRGGNW